MAGQGKSRRTRNEIETQDQSRVQRPEKGSDQSDLTYKTTTYLLFLSANLLQLSLQSIPPPGESSSPVQQYEAIYHRIEAMTKPKWRRATPFEQTSHLICLPCSRHPTMSPHQLLPSLPPPLFALTLPQVPHHLRVVSVHIGLLEVVKGDGRSRLWEGPIVEPGAHLDRVAVCEMVDRSDCQKSAL